MYRQPLIKNGTALRFPTHTPTWHKPCNLSVESLTAYSRRTAMKFETLMLNSLFAACLVICVATLGAMLA